MAYFSKTNHPRYDDDEIAKAIRKSRTAKAKDYDGGFGEEYFHNRLSMPSYLKQIINTKNGKITQEAVYKRISQGVGKNALNNLIQYITRSSEEQKLEGLPKTDLYDENGIKLTDEQIKNIKEEWAEDFASKTFQEKHPQRSKALIEFHNEVQMLSIKESSGDITENERDKLEALRLGGVRKNIWEAGTVVELDNNHKGIVHKIEKSGKVVIELEDGQDQKYKTYSKIDVNPSLTKEGFSINKYKDQNEAENKTALDDKNFLVATPNFVEAKKSLPKDFEHFVLSVGGDAPDRKKSFLATKDFLNENLHERGFRYLFAEHEDSGHLHYHVIAHRTNILDKKRKFPTGMHDSYVFRKEYCDTLSQRGVKRTATLSNDRANMIELSRSKAEKGITRSRRFKSQKANPEAGGLFAEYWSMNEYLDKVEEKMDDYKIPTKEKKEIKNILDISRVTIKLDDEKSFNNAVNGFTESLKQKSAEMGDFWEKVMTPEKLKDFDTDYMAKYRDQKAIEAQDKQTQRFLQSYQGLSMVMRENKDKKEMVSRLEPLINETEKMIYKSEQLKAYAQKTEPKFRKREDIEKYLDLTPKLGVTENNE